MNRIAIAAVCLTVMSFGAGCKIVVTGSSTYETCYSTADCTSSADVCVGLSTGDAFCSQSCRDDFDCPGAGRCLSADGGSSFYCFDTCTTSTFCEPGWTCQGASGGSNVCLPDTMPPPGLATYQDCTSTSQCDSTADACVSVTNGSFTDSQCTRGCTDDRDCPGTGHCVSFDGVNSFCYEICATNSSCESGWGCTDLSDGAAICLPGNGTPTPVGIPAYNECNPSDDQCVSSVEGCFTISVDGVSAGVCTSGCTTSASCPITAAGLAGECVSFDSGRNFTCFESCRDTNDCLVGFACKSSLADGSTFPPICLPVR